MSGSATTVATGELETEWVFAGNAPVQFSFAVFAIDVERMFADTSLRTATMVSERGTPLAPPEMLVVGDATRGAVTVFPTTPTGGPATPPTRSDAEVTE
jgi:hypothetical protein